MLSSCQASCTFKNELGDVGRFKIISRSRVVREGFGWSVEGDDFIRLTSFIFLNNQKTDYSRLLLNYLSAYVPVPGSLTGTCSLRRGYRAAG
jgi:hypothetical protein